MSPLPTPDRNTIQEARRAGEAFAVVANATEGILQIRDRFSVRGIADDMGLCSDEDNARHDTLNELTGLSDELGLYA